jgi:putative transposase
MLFELDDQSKAKRHNMTTTSYQSLSHSTWECKYHVVFGPKYRKSVLYGKIREFLKSVFHELARQKECTIVAGNLAGDHVHMLISIPPKYAASTVIGFLKGKTAIAVARRFGGKTRNFNGERFWARGYAISTVGFNKEQIRVYIKQQQERDERNPFGEDGNF